MMKFFSVMLVSLLANSGILLAKTDGGLQSLLISEELKVNEEADSAKSQASKLLDSAPKKIEIKGMKSNPSYRRAQMQKKAESFEEAPLGLSWGADTNYIKATGVILEDISNEAEPRTFYGTYLPKPVDDFDRVALFFGLHNKLWRIVVETKPMEDDVRASKMMMQFRKYNRLLEQKYGGAEIIYNPKIINVEKIVELENGRTTIEIETEEKKISNNEFLQEIKNNEAELFAVFDDGTVGVTLQAVVDENNKSYIVIDYKNLAIIKELENKIIDAI